MRGNQVLGRRRLFDFAQSPIMGGGKAKLSLTRLQEEAPVVLIDAAFELCLVYEELYHLHRSVICPLEPSTGSVTRARAIKRSLADPFDA